MDRFYEQLTAWRHELHQIPETAFEEFETSAYVAEKLKEMGYEVTTGLGGTGVVGRLSCGTGKKVIALRADMDALPQAEQGCPEYVSRHEKKMHGCGHDGHVATLLGAAKLLSERRDFNGTVCLVFQPAEEPGRGAQAMLRDGLLETFGIEEIYGMHNLPNYSAGTVLTRAGGIMASEDNFTIRIHGKGGHASSPHLGIDPLTVAAEVILSLQTIVSRTANPVHPVVISCTELHTDGIHNVIPSNVVLTGDTRSTTPEDQAMIEKRMRGVTEGICATAGAACEFEYTHEFVPTVNTRECSDVVAKAAAAVVGSEKVFADCEPWMASEDFGHYLENIPGCFFFLGSGRTGTADAVPLHNPRYDYNDEVLTTGARVFAEIVRERLS